MCSVVVWWAVNGVGYSDCGLRKTGLTVVGIWKLQSGHAVAGEGDLERLTLKFG